MSDLQLDPDLIMALQTLEANRVEFVLVGDLAEAIYDHGGLVAGLEMVPGGYGRNVERLISALDAMQAELGIAGRPDPQGRDWHRTHLIDIAPCTFMTSYVDIDVDFQPAGTNGYRDLFQDSSRIQLAPGARPDVASPEDLDRMSSGSAAMAPVPPALPPAALPPEPGAWPAEDIRAGQLGRARY